MKTILSSTIGRPRTASLFCLWMAALSAVSQNATVPAPVAVTNGQYLIVDRSDHQRVWGVANIETNDAGEVTLSTNAAYTELATGICYQNANGEYVDSVEAVAIVADGAQAVQGRHKVHWMSNINTPKGAVNVTTADGKTLLSTVYGLAYLDVSTGSNVLIAPLKNCLGEVAEPNEVLYPDAFSNVKASIDYWLTKAGLSQDIILLQQPPSPSAYGLNPASTYLQVLTEFFSATAPVATAVTNNGVEDEPYLDFGDMAIGVGHAFLTQAQGVTEDTGPVQKQWVTSTAGHQVLIEQIPFSSISNQVSALPAHTSAVSPGRSIRHLASTKPSLPGREAPTQFRSKRMRLAQAETCGPRLVVDYQLLSSSGTYTLQSDIRTSSRDWSISRRPRWRVAPASNIRTPVPR